MSELVPIHFKLLVSVTVFEQMNNKSTQTDLICVSCFHLYICGSFIDSYGFIDQN